MFGLIVEKIVLVSFHVRIIKVKRKGFLTVVVGGCLKLPNLFT
jgi:hypothetical protein